MSSEVPLILQLSKDCLCCIFSYLDLPELLIAGRVCKTFEGIAQMFYKNYRSVDFKKLSIKFNKMRIRDPGLNTAYRKLEPHMVAMKIYDLFDQRTFNCHGFSNFVFPNLQHISLGFPSVIDEKYATIFPALKQIVLRVEMMRNENTKVPKKWFENSPHLKILKFIGISDMWGICLTDLKGIEELKIHKCENFEEDLFEQFCQLNPQLKKLSFDLHINPRDNRNRRNTFLTIIAKYLKNLESLVIIDDLAKRRYEYDETNYGILRDLPKITKLRIHLHAEKHFSKHPILDYFAKNNHIEYLNVNAGYTYLMDLLQNFSHLKGLILWNFCVTPGNTPKGIPCSETLEELHLLKGFFAATDILKDLILQLKSLRLLNLCGCNSLDSSLLVEIEECLCNKTQILEFAVNGTPLAEELTMEPKSDVLKAFLDRTKGKVKFAIDSYTRDGQRKKSFHEWDEWEGEQREEQYEEYEWQEELFG